MTNASALQTRRETLYRALIGAALPATLAHLLSESFSEAINNAWRQKYDCAVVLRGEHDIQMMFSGLQVTQSEQSFQTWAELTGRRSVLVPQRQSCIFRPSPQRQALWIKASIQKADGSATEKPLFGFSRRILLLMLMADGLLHAE